MDNRLSLSIKNGIATFVINDIEVELEEKVEIELVYVFAKRLLKKNDSKMLVMKDVVITDVSEAE